MIKRYSNKSTARKTKIRAKLKRLADRHRLTVFRSNKYIYSQIIDDKKGETLVSASEKDIKIPNTKHQTPNTKIDKAFQLGRIIAEKALKKKIKQVYFDRGAYKYHGRIKSFVEGARKEGLDL